MKGKPKPLSLDADPPKDGDEDARKFGFWRAWGQRRARALGNALQTIRRLEHELERTRVRLRKRSYKVQRLRQDAAGHNP